MHETIKPMIGKRAVLAAGAGVGILLATRDAQGPTPDEVGFSVRQNQSPAWSGMMQRCSRSIQTAGHIVLSRLPGGWVAPGRRRNPSNGIRPVSLATLSRPQEAHAFSGRASAMEGDGEVTPAIVAHAGPSISGESPPAEAGAAALSLGDCGMPQPCASPLPPVLDALDEPFAPPTHISQGGHWYGESVSFATAAEGSFQYLPPTEAITETPEDDPGS